MNTKYKKLLNSKSFILKPVPGCLPAVFVQCLLAVVAGCASTSAAVDLSVSRPGIVTESPWLLDAAAFVQEFDLSMGEPGLSSRGAFGVGNGYVFGLVGLGMPQNMLTNLAGPVYEKDEAERFFPIWTTVSQAVHGVKEAVKVRFTRSLTYRVRNTPIVVNSEKSDDLAVFSVTIAPPLWKSIIRIISVKNLSEKQLEGLSLDVESREGKDTAQTYKKSMLVQSTGGKRMIVGFFGQKQIASPGNPGKLTMPIGTLRPGQEDSFVLFINFGNENDPVDLPTLEKNSQKSMLEATREESLDWLNGAMTVTSSDKRIADLFDSLYMILKVQTDANSSGISQMGKYSGIWCRDTFGPVRFLLTTGQFEPVAKMLHYYDYATRIGGFRNRYPLDLDISKAPEKVDWESMTPQQGDDPNLLILQFYWYFRATGDVEFVREHYGFLRRNLTGQKQSGDWRLPFHGDETYQVYVMIGEKAPMDAFFSADTSFAYAAAARAMAEMAAAAGEAADAADFAARAETCRAKAEEYYWNAERGYYIPYVKKDTLAPAASPFADINLHPIWYEYAGAGGANQRENVINTGKKLMNKRGTMKSTAKTGYYTGMVPGLLLWNLKAVGLLGRADAAYGAMMSAVVSPAGEFAEAYDSKDRWVNYGTAPTVYRSWESAINVEAILYYIMGLSYPRAGGRAAFQPHLPPGVDWVKFENLRAGRNRFEVSIRRVEGVDLEIEVKNTGDAAAEVELITEPVPGLSPGGGAEAFELKAYARTLWRLAARLEPGGSVRALSGPPAE